MLQQKLKFPAIIFVHNMFPILLICTPFLYISNKVKILHVFWYFTIVHSGTCLYSGFFTERDDGFESSTVRSYTADEPLNLVSAVPDLKKKCNGFYFLPFNDQCQKLLQFAWNFYHRFVEFFKK